jgi:hypothetical protein
LAAAFASQSGSSGEHVFRACGAIFGIRPVVIPPKYQKIDTARLCIPENIYFCSRSVAIKE